jgi:hypothetical protein
LEIALKVAKIDGEIPTIDLKNVKMSHFPLLNRKTSAYISRNELYSALNRKVSAYFKFFL